MDVIDTYARMITFQEGQGMIDSIVSITQDSLVTLAKDPQGFRGGIALTDRGAGKISDLTLWETESDMVSGENDGYLQGQVGSLKDLLADTPIRRHFEVSIQA